VAIFYQSGTHPFGIQAVPHIHTTTSVYLQWIDYPPTRDG